MAFYSNTVHSQKYDGNSDDATSHPPATLTHMCRLASGWLHVCSVHAHMEPEFLKKNNILFIVCIGEFYSHILHYL